jgi:Rieske Fe-S protein
LNIETMILNRRQFLLLTAGLAAGCQAWSDGGATTAKPERMIAAGPANNYAADGVYNNFRDQGFFVIRRDGKLFALSAICTHRNCKLTAGPDRSFYCKCHGSTFAPDGHVTKGPARRDLPVLATVTDANGQLLVKLP